MEPQTLYELFQQVVSAHPTRVAYRYKKEGGWKDVTWSEHRDVVAGITRSLIAIDVSPSDRVAILSQSRLEWVQCDFATVSAGGVTVGIYHSNLAAECAHIINHSGAEVIFVENSTQLQKMQSLRGELPGLRQIVLIEGTGDAGAGILGWQEFLQLGREVPDSALEARGRATRPDDLASLVYTSGTTGTPKGVMITHRNLVFISWSAGQCLSIEPHFITLFFLPLAHVFARLIIHCCLRRVSVVAFAEDLGKLAENLQEIRPHFILSVPRIYEKFQEKIMARVAQLSPLRQKLFHWALEVGGRAGQLEQRGERLPISLRFKHALADRLALGRVRSLFGGRLAWAVSGGAPLNPSIAEFFQACGITILEGIGMTENTSFSNVNRMEKNKIGTVGPPGPEIEVSIAADGEVLFRGANVMAGYYRSPTETAEAIDSEGWLHSGDIGEIDADGFLKITDRKKDLIITSGGKNVAPQRIERILCNSPYIAQALAYGDRRKFISALVTLNADNIRRWAKDKGLGAKGLEELAASPEVEALVQSEIDGANRQLASFESVKRFRIVPREFTIESGELTPTLKIKRKVVVAKYQDLLEKMYAA